MNSSQQEESVTQSQSSPSTPPQLSLSELNKLRMVREEEKRKESETKRREKSSVRMQQRPNPQQPQGLYTQDDQNNNDNDDGTDIDDDDDDDEDDQTGNENRKNPIDQMDIDTIPGNESVEIPHSQFHSIQMPPPLHPLVSHGTIDGSSSRLSTRIQIKVVNSGGNEVFFKIKRKTSLKRLMDVYCEKQGLNRGSVRFTFDGSRIDPNATPISLQMNNHDVIDAMVEQVGGSTFVFHRNFRQRFSYRKKRERYQRTYNPLRSSNRGNVILVD